MAQWLAQMSYTHQVEGSNPSATTTLLVDPVAQTKEQPFVRRVKVKALSGQQAEDE
jgi:hypothetical protein